MCRVGAGFSLDMAVAVCPKMFSPQPNSWQSQYAIVCVSALRRRQLLQQLGFALRAQADSQLLLIRRPLVVPVEGIAHRRHEIAEAQAMLDGPRRADEHCGGARAVRRNPERNLAFLHEPVFL